MSRKRHINTCVTADHYDQVTIVLSSWTHEKGKDVVYLKNELIPLDRYFKEFELFNCKSAPNKLILICSSKRKATNDSNLCFLEPAI